MAEHNERNVDPIGTYVTIEDKKCTNAEEPK